MYLKELPLFTVNETRMKVKVFVHHSMDNVEKELNQWLEQKGIRICHVTQSQCKKQGKFVFVVSIFYKIKEEWQASAG